MQPLAIIKTLHQCWPIVEFIASQGRTHGYLQSDLRDIIAERLPDLDALECTRTLQRLIESGVLEALPRQDTYVLSTWAAQLLNALLNEQDLVTSHEIRGLVDSIDTTLKRLDKALQDDSALTIEQQSTALDRHIKRISSQIANNHLAILAIAERARANTEPVALETRYAEVLEAFDDYLDPMLRMLDVKGPLHKTLTFTEQQLQFFISKAEKLGKHFRSADQSRVTVARILDLRQHGRLTVQAAANQLLPLRQQLRRQTAMTGAIAKVLGTARKRGVDYLFARCPIPALPSVIQSPLLGSDLNLQAYIASLSQLQPDDLHVELEQPRNAPAPTVSKADALARFRQAGTVANLWLWVSEVYPDAGLRQHLRLYEVLAARSAGGIRLARQRYRTATHTISLCPLGNTTYQDNRHADAH